MEFEIEDQDEGEEALFDDSTNPSLRHKRHQHGPLLSTHRPADPGEKLGLQKAELIPEEEQQLA